MASVGREYIRRHAGWIIFVLAVLARLWAIAPDLPDIYHSDEPHHLNIAARFSTGDLNPHDFKYPTLWSYSLAGALGLLYGTGRLTGLVDSTEEFGRLFVNNPAIFYFLARLTALSVGSLAALIFFRFMRRFYGLRPALAGGLMIALAPFFVLHGRQATPYALLIFCVALAMDRFHVYIHDHNSSGYYWGSFFTGLAASAYYLAAPLVLWCLVMPLFNRRPLLRTIKMIIFGAVLAGAGFFVGTPYSLLDFPHFWADLRGMKEVQNLAGSADLVNALMITAAAAAKNLAHFLDSWGLGMILIALCFIVDQTKKGAIRLLAWLSPLALLLPLVAAAHYGKEDRYLAAVFPPLVLAASLGFSKTAEFLKSRVGLPPVFMWLLIFLPLARETAGLSVIRADTRTLAKNWLKANAEPSAKIFVTDPYYCPQLKMAARQAQRLWQRTKASGHPREHYYRLMYQGHSGGGYEIYYFRRTALEAQDIPRRTELSYQGQDWIDPETEGLAAFRKRDIRFAVLCGASVAARQDSGWLKKLQDRCPLRASFEPEKNSVAGPRVAIFELSGQCGF
ncbi:MAG: glycosyltransferase family 39 protein [Elusimicrobia bacterium]|nr:glycosyltransferase family 39 protein [Elusimicrobiota bacterium]